MQHLSYVDINYFWLLYLQMYKKYEKCCVIAGGREVPAETFAGAHPSGWRRHIVVGTGLRLDRATASEKTHGENVFSKFY